LVQINLQTDWQNELKQAFCDPIQLLEYLKLPVGDCSQWLRTEKNFGLRVPRPYVEQMRKGDPNDPLLRQVLPLRIENQKVANFSSDPVGDQFAKKMSGFLQKYQGRALLMPTGACAIHCRYCFRRNYPYSTLDKTLALKAIRDDSSITEIILSGGDPLIVTDKYLADLIEKIENIPHIKRLRFHTRLPIVLPQRVTQTLLNELTKTRLKIVMVIHANHPNEISETVSQALQKLARANIILLNQSVLLRGVNDNIQTLIALSEILFENKVLPYYLHTLDRAHGTAHFDVTEDKALTLIEEMRVSLSGFLVPKLVREIAGMPYKKPL